MEAEDDDATDVDVEKNNNFEKFEKFETFESFDNFASGEIFVQTWHNLTQTNKGNIISIITFILITLSLYRHVQTTVILLRPATNAVQCD